MLCFSSFSTVIHTRTLVFLVTLLIHTVEPSCLRSVLLGGAQQQQQQQQLARFENICCFSSISPLDYLRFWAFLRFHLGAVSNWSS